VAFSGNPGRTGRIGWVRLSASICWVGAAAQHLGCRFPRPRTGLSACLDCAPVTSSETCPKNATSSRSVRRKRTAAAQMTSTLNGVAIWVPQSRERCTGIVAGL
jgi:hypothetical protein